MNLELITLGLGAVNTVGLGVVVWLNMHGQKQLKNQMVVDTSGLIDGRIIDVVQAGFVPKQLIIPQCVIAELQFLADQGDSFKRERARYGLDVVRRLQDMRHIDVVISTGRVRGEKAVDDKLVSIAKKRGAMLYTTDFNLNQVAEIEGVRVLNVNELAQGLRAMHLPGEKTEIKITQAGQDRSQGVGYLEDGTMVVVEQAGKKIGQKVYVEFSRMLQTQAGKMMFAVMPKAHGERTEQREHAARPPQPHVPAQRAPAPAQAPTAQAVPLRRPSKEDSLIQAVEAQHTPAAQPKQKPRRAYHHRPKPTSHP